MSINILNLKDVISTIKDPKNDLFYIPNNSVRHFRFAVNDIDSFIPLEVHNYSENDGRFDRYITKLCSKGKCVYCSDEEKYGRSIVTLFLPVYETKENGSLLTVQNEMIWKLPYLNLYNNFKHLHQQVKQSIKDYVFHISKMEGKYDVKYNYVLSFHNDINYSVSYHQYYWHNKIIDIYGDGTVSKFKVVNNEKDNDKNIIDLKVSESKSTESNKSNSPPKKGKGRYNNYNANLPVVDGKIVDNNQQTASPTDSFYQ